MKCRCNKPLLSAASRLCFRCNARRREPPPASAPRCHRPTRTMCKYRSPQGCSRCSNGCDDSCSVFLVSRGPAIWEHVCHECIRNDTLLITILDKTLFGLSFLAVLPTYYIRYSDLKQTKKSSMKKGQFKQALRALGAIIPAYYMLSLPLLAATSPLSVPKWTKDTWEWTM